MSTKIEEFNKTFSLREATRKYKEENKKIKEQNKCLKHNYKAQKITLEIAYENSKIIIEDLKQQLADRDNKIKELTKED